MRFFKYFVLILIILILVCALELYHLDLASDALLSSGLILQENILAGRNTDQSFQDFDALWQRYRPWMQLYMEPNLMLSAEGALSRARGALSVGFLETAAESITELLDMIKHMHAREQVRWQNIF